MFVNRIPFDEKTEIPVLNSMRIFFWHCRFANPNSNPMYHRSFYTRYLLIWDVLVFINFNKLQKICFSQTFISSDLTEILRILIFANLVKTFIWRTYIFAKTAKFCGTFNDFRDVERYCTVTWKSVIKHTFENQALSSWVTKQTSLIFELQVYLSKQESLIFQLQVCLSKCDLLVDTRH